MQASKCSISLFCVARVVITHALGLHGVYCTQPEAAPSGFSAIYTPYNPSCPGYNCTYSVGVLIAHEPVVVEYISW